MRHIDLPAEDLRKLHAEINQLLNHQFLITTTAIALFGAFVALLAPKNLGDIQDPRFLVLATGCILASLAGLYSWNKRIVRIISDLSAYLIVTRASLWEYHYRQARPKQHTGSLQRSIFFVVGLMAILWAGILFARTQQWFNTVTVSWWWAGTGISLPVLYLSYVSLPRPEDIQHQVTRWEHLLSRPGIALTTKDIVAPNPFRETILVDSISTDRGQLILNTRSGPVVLQMSDATRTEWMRIPERLGRGFRRDLGADSGMMRAKIPEASGR